MNGVCERCGDPIELSDETLMDFGPRRGQYLCDDCWNDEPIPAVIVNPTPLPTVAATERLQQQQTNLIARFRDRDANRAALLKHLADDEPRS